MDRCKLLYISHDALPYEKTTRMFSRGNVDRAMVLHCYFQPSSALQDSSGLLSAHVSPAVIKDANEAVRSASQGSISQKGNMPRTKGMALFAHSYV